MSAGSVREAFKYYLADFCLGRGFFFTINPEICHPQRLKMMFFCISILGDEDQKWIGMGWRVIIGQRSSKSPFGSNKRPLRKYIHMEKIMTFLVPSHIVNNWIILGIVRVRLTTMVKDAFTLLNFYSHLKDWKPWQPPTHNYWQSPKNDFPQRESLTKSRLSCLQNLLHLSLSVQVHYCSSPVESRTILPPLVY